MVVSSGYDPNIFGNSSSTHHHHYHNHRHGDSSPKKLLRILFKLFLYFNSLGNIYILIIPKQTNTTHSASHGPETRKSSSSPVLALRFLSGYLCSSRVGNIQPLTFPSEARFILNNTSVETALDTIRPPTPPPPLVLCPCRVSPCCHRLMVLQSSRRIIIPFRSAILC